MSSVSPRHHCWMILASTSAEETSRLIDVLEREDPEKFRQISNIRYCHDNWRQGRLTDHDFMHRVKATIDNEIGVTVCQEANQFVQGVLQNHRKST